MKPAHSMSLRVVDAGSVSALRSQALWHGIAAAMQRGAAPTLSFCRPAEPYVGLGYHRRLDEIDLDACRRLGLPVIRRQIGGGPVYLDSDQLFFQITLPAELAPPRVDHLYERFLEPAAAAFRTLGLEVRRGGGNDLAVADRKISGTGAGRIEGGVTVVGNVLFRFPHRRMTEVLALPSARLRAECLRLMRRHVTSLAAEGLAATSAEAATGALVEAYARALGRRPVAAALTASEEAAIAGWEERFRDPAWLAGPAQPARGARRIKVSADAWIVTARHSGMRLEASAAGGKIERLWLAAPSLNGAAAAIERAVTGRPATAEALRPALEPFGDDGRRVLELLTLGLRAH